ncbi:MAG TPA: isochorismatase family cysteine hydrolase [Candidatus Bathyarchaeia archaeon]|nr:isochorismatase family cysteine hydrolase [Candidatus Bathyarchaeia archaeon]
MKPLCRVIPLFVLFAGFAVAAQESAIPKSEGPKTALLVLDMQEDFLGVDAKMPILREQIPALTAVVNSLIDEFEKNGQEIIYVKSEFPKIALGNRIRHHAAIKGSPGTNIYGRIRISGRTVFSKKTPDAFSNREFAAYLEAHQIKRLVMTGVFADQCVLSTTMAALDRNYQITFVRNGVGARSDKDVTKACEKVQKRGAKVIDYQPHTPIE